MRAIAAIADRRIAAGSTIAEVARIQRHVQLQKPGVERQPTASSFRLCHGEANAAGPESFRDSDALFSGSRFESDA